MGIIQWCVLRKDSMDHLLKQDETEYRFRREMSYIQADISDGRYQMKCSS